MARNASPSRDQDDEIEITGQWPLLPEGEYQGVFLHHETASMFRTKQNPNGTGKVFLHFRIVEPAEFANCKIYAAYRVGEIVGRTGKHGRFNLKPRSELFLAMARLFGASKRMDRISLRWLRSCLLCVTVRTVKKDYRQRDLPECCWYSVVDEIKGIDAGTPGSIPGPNT